MTLGETVGRTLSFMDVKWKTSIVLDTERGDRTTVSFEKRGSRVAFGEGVDRTMLSLEVVTTVE